MPYREQVFFVWKSPWRLVRHRESHVNEEELGGPIRSEDTRAEWRADAALYLAANRAAHLKGFDASPRKQYDLHAKHDCACRTGTRPYGSSVRSRLRRMNMPSRLLLTTMMPLSKNG